MPLFILKQTSLTEDTIVDGGVSKTIHTVVKNSPFAILVGQRPEGTVPSGPFINFNDYAINCILIYDTSENKPVDFIKNEPIYFKPTVLNDGAALQIEAKLKVLTSKHEDMNFKVLIKLLPLNPQMNTPLEIISRPIKVISKPEQIKKKRKGPGEDEYAPLQKNPRVKMNILPEGIVLQQIPPVLNAKDALKQQPTLVEKTKLSAPAPVVKPILIQTQTQTQSPTQTQQQQQQQSNYSTGYNAQQQQQQQQQQIVQPKLQQPQIQQVSQTYSSLEDLTSSYAITRSLDNNIIESLQRIESKETSYLGFIEEVCSFIYNVVGSGGTLPFQQQQQQQQQQQSQPEVPLSSEVLTSVGGAGGQMPSAVAAAAAAISGGGNGNVGGGGGSGGPMGGQDQNPYYQGNMNGNMNMNYYESDRTVSCLLDSFGRLSQVERASQVRRIMNVLSAEQKSNVSEMIEFFFNEGLENTRNERLRMSAFSSSTSSSTSSSSTGGVGGGMGGNGDYYFQQAQPSYFNDPSDLSNIWM